MNLTFDPVAALLCGDHDGLWMSALIGAGFAVLLIHSVWAFGRCNAAIFVVISLAVGYGVENVALRTGFPFGRYGFRLWQVLPHVGRAPLLIGALYFILAYIAWSVAALLAVGDGHDAKSPRVGFAVPIVGAFIATQVDLVFDPVGATLCRAWVWYDGGGYLGIPLSNFLGVFGTFWFLLQIIALCSDCAFLRPRTSDAIALQGLPVAVLLAAGLSRLPALSAPDARLLDGGGHVWSATALREAAALVALLTLAPMGILALLRLDRRVRRQPLALLTTMNRDKTGTAALPFWRLNRGRRDESARSAQPQAARVWRPRRSPATKPPPLPEP